MFLDEITLSIVGIAAGILILSGWVHQIFKGYKTKKLDDVSKYLLVLIFVGALLWLVYGIEIDDPYVIGVNVAAMILMVIVLAMKINYTRKRINV